jgi:hypothetical protein
MSGSAIPIAVIAVIVLWFSVGIYRRGRALRTRGVHTQVTCVSEAREKSGAVTLLVRFQAQSGAALQTSVGPFRYPPARPGGVLDVIYDPQDPGNIETPDKVTNGRTALAFTLGSTTVLAVCLVLIVLGFLG